MLLVICLWKWRKLFFHHKFMECWARLCIENSYRTKWNDLLVAQQVDGPNGERYLNGKLLIILRLGFCLQISISQGLMPTLILPIRFFQRYHPAILINIFLTGTYWRTKFQRQKFTTNILLSFWRRISWKRNIIKIPWPHCEIA